MGDKGSWAAAGKHEERIGEGEGGRRPQTKRDKRLAGTKDVYQGLAGRSAGGFPTRVLPKDTRNSHRGSVSAPCSPAVYFCCIPAC